MAIFGEGMTGPDPLAEARANAAAKARKRTDDNIRRLGEGSGAFDKGVIALGEVGGEWLGHGIAKLFGRDTEDPEVTAAKQEAELANQINQIEGDPASADYARQAGQYALDAGRQDLAYQFAQESGVRNKAELANAAKTAASEKKAYLDGYKAQPTEIQLAVLGSGDEQAWDVLDIPPGKERDELQKQAQTAFNSLQTKNKAAADKVNESRSTSVSNADVKAAQAWMPSAGIGAEQTFMGGEEGKLSADTATATLIATGAKLLLVQAEEAGNPISQADAWTRTTDALIDSGRIKVETETGSGWFGFGKPNGYRTVTGFGEAAVPAPQAESATAPGTQATRRVILGQ